MNLINHVIRRVKMKQSMKQSKSARQQKKASKESNQNQSNENFFARHIWKIISISFISIFVLILLLGLIKHFQIRHMSQPVSQEKIDSIKSAVLSDLQTRGENISSDIKVAPMTRLDQDHSRKDGTERRIIEASVDSENKRITYLLDANTNEILMRSEVQFFGWMNESGFPRPQRQEGQAFMRERSWRPI
jgi:hypothetical protein